MYSTNCSTSGSQPAKLPEIFSANELDAMDLPPMRMVVQDLLPVGLTVLGGAPKTGKSVAMLQLALAVASGWPFLDHFKTRKGDVLYITLEDGHHRLKSRMLDLLDDNEVPENLAFALRWPDLEKDGFKQIEEWLNQHPKASMVIIDTVGRVRRGDGLGRSAYHSDTKFGEPLQQMALDHQISILAVTHTRKEQNEDWTATISGTFGFTGIADTIWKLEVLRADSRGSLLVTGRDVENQRLSLESTRSKGWTYKGEPVRKPLTIEQQEVLDFLVQMHEPQKLSEIREHFGEENKSRRVDQLLQKLERDDFVHRVGRGVYAVSNLESHTLDTTIDAVTSIEGNMSNDSCRESVDAEDANPPSAEPLNHAA